MFDNIIAGAAVGAITGGIGEGISAGFSLAAQSGASMASVAAYGTAGAVSGALSGASMAAINGGDVGKGALLGGVFGSAGGALGGYLKHFQFKSAVFNSSRYLAECKDCAAMFPGVSGTWLDPVYITGQRTLATGAVQPSYFFEELVLGNGIGKLASGIVGMIKGVGFVAKGGNAVIKGFTQHAAAESAISRGFKTADILKIGREGTHEVIRSGTQIRYTLQSNSIVVQQTGRNAGKIVTVFSNAPGTAKGLGKGFFIPWK